MKQFLIRSSLFGVLATALLASTTTSYAQTTAAPVQARNKPAQPAAIIFGDRDQPPASYMHPGALVIAGRANYNLPAFKSLSKAGGTELIYIDPMIDASFGRYHQLLLKSSACGPPVPNWPGNPSANQWGHLTDFRQGGVLQKKLGCVLETMARENPQMGGFFLDDVGSRSYYPDIDWDSWSAADKQAYRNGAILLTQTARKVANAHGLVVFVNGTWNAGTVAAAGGGYPNLNQHGNALVDGAMIEHHDTDDISGFFKQYACSKQWAASSPVTHGISYMMATNNTKAGLNKFVATGCIAYATVQTTDNYGTAPAPWTAFHPAALPARTAR